MADVSAGALWQGDTVDQYFGASIFVYNSLPDGDSFAGDSIALRNSIVVDDGNACGTSIDVYSPYFGDDVN